MIYIKDMDMPADCLACRISCKHESYMVPGRPEDCPLEEAKDGDLISRADAIEAVRVCDVFLAYQGDKIANNIDGFVDSIVEQMRDNISRAVSALPSADAVSREEYDQLEALYDAIRIYDSSAEAVQGEWIDTGNWMGIECSRCKCHSRYVTPFCPQCGAKMKGGEDE